MAKSISYRQSLIKRLKNPSYSAKYLEAILSEPDAEPELFISALMDVVEALGELNLSTEDALLHQSHLQEILSSQGSQEIYRLANWLKTLGLKITFVVDQENYSNVMTNGRELLNKISIAFDQAIN